MKRILSRQFSLLTRRKTGPLLFLLLLLGTVVQAQILNTTINTEVHFVQGSIKPSSPGYPFSNTSYKVKATVDTDNQPTNQFNHIKGQMESSFCYSNDNNNYAPESLGPVVDGVILQHVDGSQQYDLEVFTWIDYSKNCNWDEGDQLDGYEVKLMKPTLDPSNVWTPFNGLVYSSFYGGPSRYYMKHTWRYYGGAAINNPLNFGIVDSNTKSHINSNRKAPDGALPFMGYANNFELTPSKPTGGRDVVYTFTLSQTSNVILSTLFDQTDFNTVIHLFKYDESGPKLGAYIGSNDDALGSNKSYLQTSLCSGRYAVIVEGAKYEDEGTFNLSIETYPVAPAIISTSNVYNNLLPNPLEVPTASLNFSGGGIGPFTYAWEKSEGNGGFVHITGVTGGTLSLSALQPSTNPSPSELKTVPFKFHLKVTDGCSRTVTTNDVSLTMVLSNGFIDGHIQTTAANGSAAVSGVKVCIVKANVPGSPASYTQCTTTNNEGNYRFSPIYYGPPNNNSPVSFTITPSLVLHTFKPTSIVRTLDPLNPRIGDNFNGVNFEDETALGVTGTVSQTCVFCLDASVQNPTVCPMDGATIKLLQNGVTKKEGKSGYLDTPPPAAYGRYAIAVNEPGNYTVTASYGNHTLTPAVYTLNVSTVQTGINFIDSQMHRITGYLRDGCGKPLSGTATLTFSDVLPDAADGTQRSSCFRQQVVINGSQFGATGYYNIQLPARKYRLISIDYKPSTLNVQAAEYISPQQLKAFFEPQLTMLVRDVTESDATLDLTFHRKPYLKFAAQSLPNACTSVTFAVGRQGVALPFTVEVYEGNPATANSCSVSSGTVTGSNTIQEENLPATPVVNGIASFTLVPGEPNSLSPFLRNLTLRFTDEYGQKADDLFKTVFIQGDVRPGTTFTTTSPELVTMVLHDPPGNKSFSAWSTSQTYERAVRFYSQKAVGVEPWVEVKIGTDFSTGIGVVFESKAWGSVNQSVNTTKYNTTSSEAIFSSTIQSEYRTEEGGSPGAASDVFIGQALNLIYGKSVQFSFNQAACQIDSVSRLMIASDKNQDSRTTFFYTQAHILNTVIPNLKNLRNAEDPAAPIKTNKYNYYQKQVSMWEQLLANNEENKRNARFVENVSFGSGSFKTLSETTRTSSNNTVEFGLSIDSQTAGELGFEFAGSGVSGGVIVNVKMDNGQSESTTNMKEITFAYTLAEDASTISNGKGNSFNVNVKKDPVYGSPVFDLIAGETSCPHMPGTFARDVMQLYSTSPVKTGIVGNKASFPLTIGNASSTGENRTYNLALNSIVNGLTVKLNGENGQVLGSVGSVTPINLDAGVSGPYTIYVERDPGSGIYTFDNIQLTLSDACSTTSISTTLQAYFQTSCSPITLVMPEANWVSTASDNNRVTVVFKDYIYTDLTSVSLEYKALGSNSWFTGFTLPKTQIDDSGFGTTTYWNTIGLADGQYVIRLKLSCASGTTYSQTSTGIIDRTPPSLFGKANPTDDRYTAGDLIAATYTENLGCAAAVAAANVSMVRLSNNATLSAQLSCSGSRLIVTPLTNLGALSGESIRVTLSNIPDQYGNIKQTSDIIQFVVGSSVSTTGTTALSLAITNPSVIEDAGTPVIIDFKLPQNATKPTTINYILSGTAQLNTDYTIKYPSGQPVSTAAQTGVLQSIVLSNSSSVVSLTIVPIANTKIEANRSVLVVLTAGGDYTMGAVTSVSAIITDDDCPGNVKLIASGPLSQTSTFVTLMVNEGATTYRFGYGATQVVLKPYTATVTTPGVYSVSLTAANGCSAIASTTVVAVDPDVTLLLYARPSTLYGNGNFSVVVDAIEVNNIATSGEIIIKVTKDAKTTLSFDGSLTQLNGRSVQNNAWTFSSTESTGYYVLKTTKPIAPGDKLSFGLNGVITPGATTGKMTISATMLGVSKEYRFINNVGSNKVDYFPQ
ncbi:hypothetical protein [Spirosoma validum]|uniref:Uncharacterized protein n=1 Tax=Spirosoma validum TaxID=2771355 RepID=A0A927GDS9_9BACT|nr:hypothetical protein [Spirosoma validum]MBD2753983.1 hypothetical protein [Spirosoma validum]